LREGSGSQSQDRVLPEASWPVYVQKNLPKVWNEVLEEEGFVLAGDGYSPHHTFFLAFRGSS